jgi:hypothetical protein
VCARLTLEHTQQNSSIIASHVVWVNNITEARALDFGCSVHTLLGSRALCVSPLESQNSSVPDSPQRNAVAFFELQHPWSLQTDVKTLFTSPYGSPIVSVTWHAETMTDKSVWYSYVPFIAGVTEAMPHTLNLPTFNLLEFESS